MINVATQQRKKLFIINISGDLTKEFVTINLLNKCTHWVQQHPSTRIDCTQLKKIDCAGLSFLLECHQQALQQEHSCTLQLNKDLAAYSSIYLTLKQRTTLYDSNTTTT